MDAAVANFDRLSARARAVLAQAEQEARGLGHNYIGTEHLLLGLSFADGSAALRALSALGVEGAEVRAAIAYTIGRGEGAPTGKLALTPRAKRAIALAVEDADRLARTTIGTEHLLIGLMREGDGVGAGILAGLGVTLAQVRDQLGPLLEAQPESVRTAVETAVGRMRSRKRGGNGEAEPLKGNVITCRIADRDLAAIDALIEAGIHTTRSESAAWLIGAGIEAQHDLFEQLHATIGQIRQLRAAAQALVTPTPPTPPDPTQAQ